MQALISEDLLQEEVREDPLADEPTLEVREHAQDGVDLTGVGELLQLLGVDHALRLHGSSSKTGGAVGDRPPPRGRSDDDAGTSLFLDLPDMRLAVALALRVPGLALGHGELFLR